MDILPDISLLQSNCRYSGKLTRLKVFSLTWACAASSSPNLQSPRKTKSNQHEEFLQISSIRFKNYVSSSLRSHIIPISLIENLDKWPIGELYWSERETGQLPKRFSFIQRISGKVNVTDEKLLLWSYLRWLPRLLSRQRIFDIN